MIQTDTRNLIDELKGMTENEVITELDQNGVELEIAIENVERDFNMGSIVRSANAFGVRHVHIIGRRQWNKRGAMATDKYLHVHYYDTVESFIQAMHADSRTVLAVDNVPGAKDVRTANFEKRCVLVFGSERNGISQDIIHKSSQVISIIQKGSTRSLNVGAAAAVVMYEWSRRYDI